MLFFDPLYLIFALPGFILALIAEIMVKGTFAKYDHIGASSGMTGAEAAYRLLQDAIPTIFLVLQHSHDHGFAE